MDKLQTVDTRWGLAVVGAAMVGMIVASGAFTNIETPDPRLLAIETPPPVVEVIEPYLEPATCELAGFAMPPAAPMFEAAPVDRVLQPKIKELTVVIGLNAKPSFDRRLQGAYCDSLTTEKINPIVTSDREAVENLMIGRARFGLIGGSLSPREVRAGLRQTQIGVELFALSVSPLSSIRSLTPSQVRQIFTGQVTDWQQLGFDGGAIVPVVPSDRIMAARAERTLIPGDTFASTCVRVRSERHVADQLLQHRGAIGIIRVTAEPREQGQKLLQIDWTPPTPAAFGYGTYPYGIPLQLVTSGQPDKYARDFLDFTQSAEGRELLSRTLTFAR